MIRRHWWLPTLLGVATVAMIAATPPPNLTQALAAQQRFALERPDDPAVLNDLGNLQRLAGRYAEAEEAYRRALTIAPERATPRFNLALLLQQQGRAEAALGEFRRVVEHQPGNAWAHYQIGALLESRGENTAAIKAYARAFAIDPELSFPDVNPHVIENGLVAEALLLSQRGSAAVPQAPNAYEDPGRIASLLLPAARAAAEAVEQAVQEPAAPAEAPAPERLGRREPPREGEAVPPRTLTPDDLEPGANVGQASPSGVAQRPSGGVRAPGRSQTRFGVPTYVPPQTDAQGRPTSPDGRVIPRPPGGLVAPPAPGERTPGGSRFRPGTPSTGRLEIEVLPVPSRPPGERAG